MHKQDCNRDCGNCNFKEIPTQRITQHLGLSKKRKITRHSLFCRSPEILSYGSFDTIKTFETYQDWSTEKKIWEKCTSHTARLIDCKTPVIDLRFWQTFHFSVSFARVSLENWLLLWEKNVEWIASNWI